MQIEQLVPVPAVLARGGVGILGHHQQQTVLHNNLVHLFRQDDLHILWVGGAGPFNFHIAHRGVDLDGVHSVLHHKGGDRHRLAAPGIGKGVQIAAHGHKPGAAHHNPHAQQDAPHQGAAFQKPLFPFHAGTLPFLLKLRRIPRQMALAAFTVALPVK